MLVGGTVSDLSGLVGWRLVVAVVAAVVALGATAAAVFAAAQVIAPTTPTDTNGQPCSAFEDDKLCTFVARDPTLLQGLAESLVDFRNSYAEALSTFRSAQSAARHESSNEERISALRLATRELRSYASVGQYLRDLGVYLEVRRRYTICTTALTACVVLTIMGAVAFNAVR
jgi:hypothetical protein